jgi:hypothetical protein
MAERAIEDGFVDCPKFGIMDELRCLPSCEFFDAKNEGHIVCHFGEAAPAAAEPEAEPEGAETSPA